ncbi:MAG: hypothetical protein JWO20_41 [Candidatus Angelobacter sp.]|nr:hypothetical protein [Candidatus Angelobacter sp.]
MTPDRLDHLLYKWIYQANKRREFLDLPIGLLEDSVAVLTRVLGFEYLKEQLIDDCNPVSFLDDEANPLRKWLYSARSDAHIIQVLELATYFKIFQDDPALMDKVQKLKYDSFWPMFFELAMAARLKRASRGLQEILLNPETSSSIGDFTIKAPGFQIPCECSRLARSPQITESKPLEERLSNRISEGAKRSPIALCVKVRSSEPLTGRNYNDTLQLVRKCLSDCRSAKLPTEYCAGATTVRFEALTESSEQMPFKMVAGRVQDVTGGDWDSAARFSWVPAAVSAEIESRIDRGEPFGEFESVRLFMKFGAATRQPDNYSRLTAKLKKKLKQTKISAEHFGKIVLVEVPFDLRSVDGEKLKSAVQAAASNSNSTLAIILANREPNPQIRFHYSQSGAFNHAAATMHPQFVELLNRMAQGEMTLDMLLGLPYRRSWADAAVHAMRDNSHD